MAKALIGFIGGPTSDQLLETAMLHRRISDLEAEILRLKTENDGLLKTLRERVDQVTAGDLLESVSH
jgi:predicted deacylase